MSNPRRGFRGMIQRGDTVKVFDATNPLPHQIIQLAHTLKLMLRQPELAMLVLSPATYSGICRHLNVYSLDELVGLPIHVSLEVQHIGVRKRS